MKFVVATALVLALVAVMLTETRAESKSTLDALINASRDVLPALDEVIGKVGKLVTTLYDSLFNIVEEVVKPQFKEHVKAVKSSIKFLFYDVIYSVGKFVIFNLRAVSAYFG